MSTQVHAPPTKEEHDAILASDSTRKKRKRFKMWREQNGWCSACRAQDVVVAHLGNPDHNVALCPRCVDRFVATLSGGTDDG
jgi:hypothetical protein